MSYRDEIQQLQEGAELNEAIARLMEPMPEQITARALREKERMTDWYSVHYAYSPGGWWRAQIGTDHNYDENHTYQAARDLAPVRWEPAREPSSNIADAWLIAERLRYFSIRLGTNGRWHARFLLDGYVGATAETAPLAICRLAVQYLAAKQ